MLWHELSWPALDAVDKETPVVIPLGSCEQHGHHLPLFVDTMQVVAIAERVERSLPEHSLLLPTFWLGSSHHHLDFPGTVSLLPSLYSEVIKSIASCVLKAGFRRLLFLNGHGGNHVPVAQSLSEMIDENDQADDAYLVLSTWWETAEPVIDAERHGMSTRRLTHACEYETSVMLAIRPDLVAIERALEGPAALHNDWVSTEYEGTNRVVLFRRWRRFSASGSMGRPSEATVEKGRSILDAAIGEIIALVRDMQSWPALPPLGPRPPQARDRS